MDNNEINNIDKLKYLQTKIHEATFECINTYLLAQKNDSLFHTFLSLVFMYFRNSVDTTISIPYRIKSSQSVLDNIEKEITKMLTEKLSNNSTLKDIDEQVDTTVKAVCKDYLGATMVFHSKNNLSTYCEESDDPYVKKLYRQVLSVEEYLRSGEKDFNLDLLSRLYKHIAKIDISNTFIDDIKPSTPTKVKPLDLENINTLEDYYNTKITLLTLLTNSSIPCSESTDGKTHKYCVSEVDIPYLQLVKQAKEQNPKSKDEFIAILTDLAHQSYFREYVPFDEQLDNILKEQNTSKHFSNYRAQLTYKEKKKYIQELNNLKNNLKQIKNDRLLNYVLTLELPNIFNKLSELPNLNVEIKSSKKRAKSNGFYACYYTVELNGTVICEILGNSEFRSNLTKEGNAAHNLMPNKSFNLKPLFELRSFPFQNSPKAKEKLDFYCDFLNTVSLNDVSGYHISKEDQSALRDLQDLVDYATSKIKVKDTIEVKNGSNSTYLSFYDYMTSIICSKGADYGTIYPAHIVEHNQALAVPQNPLYSLENLLKSRIGLSTLANLVRENYIKIATTEKKKKLLSHSNVQTYSSTLTPKYDIPVDNHFIQNNYDNFEPINEPFFPMGQHPKRNNSSIDER